MATVSAASSTFAPTVSGARSPPYRTAPTSPHTTTGTARIARRPSAATGRSYSWVMPRAAT
ncbi:hypothetical protein [Thermocatellispora tengchongensis]|uniref:hypothetical protein n=1 Tax=Thermocatellispora tengchongensis TaxID=1073253 RepID=UPI00362D9E8A